MTVIRFPEFSDGVIFLNFFLNVTSSFDKQTSAIIGNLCMHYGAMYSKKLFLYVKFFQREQCVKFWVDLDASPVVRHCKIHKYHS